jgi:hypothetical protein
VSFFELGQIGGLLAGALIGYVVGTTVGAVVGCNLSREPKDTSVASRPRSDGDVALGSPAVPWTEPLRRRVAGDADVGGRLSLPLLAFRF